MPIQLTCECNRLLVVKDEFAGKKVRCPDCKQVITVPRAAPLVAELIETRPAPPRRAVPPPLPPMPPPEDAFAERPHKAPPGAIAKRPTRDLYDEDDDYDRRDEDYDDDYDDDRAPRKKKKKKPKPAGKRKSSYQSPHSGSRPGEFGTINAGVIGGLFMIGIAVIWFIVGLMAGWLFYYPPILFVMGIVAIVKGMINGSE